jgi:hypothetical protein
MKNIILIALILVVNLSFGQMEKVENKVITEKFVENYNNDDYDGIFSIFADVMKDALPIDKTTEFLKGLKSQAGNISNHKFIKYENEKGKTLIRATDLGIAKWTLIKSNVFNSEIIRSGKHFQLKDYIIKHLF